MELSGHGRRGELSQPGAGAATDDGGSAEHLRAVVHGAGPGAWNMAVDEALMAAARAGRTTLRFYAWDPACLSFGRNQRAQGRYDPAAAAGRGFEVVRRPTGGRSVLHHRELTYSVTAPVERWGGLREAYSRFNRALGAGLRELGIPARVAARRKREPTPGPTARACFRDPLPGEVTVQGRKLIGSAQWRDKGALLQHGSLLLHNDQAIVEELRGGARPATEVPAIGLADLVDPVPELPVLVEALTRAFAAELSLPVQAEELDEAEVAVARKLRRRYEDDAWTWRR